MADSKTTEDTAGGWTDDEVDLILNARDQAARDRGCTARCPTSFASPCPCLEAAAQQMEITRHAQ